MTEKSETTEFKVRVSQELRRQIVAASEANGRTLNAEIVARLTWAFEHAGDKTEERLSKLENDISELKDTVVRMIMQKMEE